MKAKTLITLVAISLCTGSSIAQERTQPTQTQSAATGGHLPPPQAYEDCKGKKAGEAVEHTTREGKVAAVCTESPQGLVARPSRPQGTTPAPSGK